MDPSCTSAQADQTRTSGEGWFWPCARLRRVREEAAKRPRRSAADREVSGTQLAAKRLVLDSAHDDAHELCTSLPRYPPPA